MTELEQWQEEILEAHPVICHYKKYQWPMVAKLNGWLPLPPEEKEVNHAKS